MHKKTKNNPLSQEIIDLIRVKPEDTERVRSKLNYTITPRPDEKPPRGKPVFCCYCSRWTKFIQKEYRMVTECCGMGSEDFHLKTVNKLWKFK